jgi:hypothetical protein
VTADIEDALKKLETAEYTAEMLKGTLESMGYVVSYEYEDHYFVDGVDSGAVGKVSAPAGNV